METTLILSVVWLTSALPQGDSQDADLKNRLQEPEKRSSELEKKKQTESGIKVEFKDGLKFKTEDGNFTAHVGGRLLTHFRTVIDRDFARSGAEDTFFIRQARIETSGTFFKDFEYKVQVDFPTGSSSTSGTLQDAFVGWKKYKACSVRIGQFKEPFSQEETTTTRFIDFDERSVVNRLVPARDIGIMLYGAFGNGIFDYETGIFNGQGRAVLDLNDDKEWALRLRTSPFVAHESEFLKGLRLGFGFTVGHLTKGSIDGLDFTSTELLVKFFDAGGATNFIDGTRMRFGGEISYLVGPFGFRAEWVRRIDEVDTATENNEKLSHDAFYLAFTYLLTGEKKVLENRTVPLAPFDLDKGDWGAFELALRVAFLEVDDEVFDIPGGIAATTNNADQVTTFTFGVNWYLTRNFRISPNFVHERFNRDLRLTQDTEETNHATGFVIRFQIDF